MNTITQDTLTNKVSLLSQEGMKLLQDGMIDEAEDKFEEVAMLIYHYRKVAEKLETSKVI